MHIIEQQQDNSSNSDDDDSDISNITEVRFVPDDKGSSKFILSISFT